MKSNLIGMDFDFDGNHEMARNSLKEIILGNSCEFCWSKRAIKLLDVVVDALAALRKSNGPGITLRMIYNSLSLEGLVNLALELKKNNIHASEIAPIDEYLGGIPGFCIIDGKYSEINDIARQQQGYFSSIILNSIHHLANQMEKAQLN
ncbi:hypothetical protein [Aeromonas veronii]|uniref:Uncharacterized protein n=1 Tax=Aeromonas veronii TaxID=654 RepID=A0A2T4N002_AERVE|nr:hypothetical protein [Aeromonas veronii]PTH80143.1 hypothetical protein DAA48_16440 [Aeromonas veronii]